MSYSPKNAVVYLTAVGGCGAGLGAAGQYLSDVNAGDYAGKAFASDAFGQAVDQAWANASLAVSSLSLNALSEICEAVWENRSPLPTAQANVAGNYAGIAQGIVALVQQLVNQVNSQGVNPNVPTGATGTSNTVTGGQTYTVLTTDAAIQLDSSNGQAPIAVLPLPAYIGETHAFVWFAWNASQVPPEIQSGGGGRLMSPITGMAQSGSSGLVAQTNFTQPGQFALYVWNGTNWLQIG